MIGGATMVIVAVLVRFSEAFGSIAAATTDSAVATTNVNELQINSVRRALGSGKPDLNDRPFSPTFLIFLLFLLFPILLFLP
jgi:hypothetical protein